MKKLILGAVALLSSLTACLTFSYVGQNYDFDVFRFVQRALNPHGEQQVEQMLKDRPNMQIYTTVDGRQRKLTSQDAIWRWAAQAYNLTINGEKVFWDKGDLTDKPLTIYADHTIPFPGQSGAIRVREYMQYGDGSVSQLDFEALWIGCVFELFNIQKAQSFLFIYNQAIEGKISRTQYVHQLLATEYQSLLDTKHFYQTVWKPWAVLNQVTSDEKLWADGLFNSAEAWIAANKGSAGYKYWENAYDTTIAPGLNKR